MAGQETPTNTEGKSEITELKEQMAEMMKMMMKMQQENTTGNFSKTSPGAKTTPPPRQGSSSKQTTKEGKGKGSETKEQQHDGQNDNMSQTEETDDENTEQPTDETNPNDDMNYRPPKDDKQPTGPQTGKETHGNKKKEKDDEIPPNNYQTRPYQNFNRNQPRPFQPQRTFDPIPVTYAELFAHLQTERILAPIAGQTPNTTAPWYDPNANCDYHSGIIGHSTETCRALKHRIQDLIDSKWLEFKDTVPTITGNPLPNHGNQGINVLEQDDNMAVVEKAEDMKTPLKVIFKVLCQQGLVETMGEGAYEDDVCLMHGILDHTIETCTEFKALVQRLLDSRLLVIEKKIKGSDIFVLERDQKIQDRIITRKFVPVLNIPAGTPSYTAPPRWVPRLYIESGATRHPGPFPYKSDKAVPWKYQGKSVAESKQTEEVVNLAGVGNMTRSGRVYSPVDLSKKIINASKGKEKIVETSEDRPEPEVTELFPEKMEREVSEEEACEFLRFIKQSEYQVIDQLSRTPAKVSLLSLLMNSEAHREVLFKVLNRAHASFRALEIANASSIEKGHPMLNPLPSNASIMMAKFMLRKGFQPGKGLGKYGQGMKNTLVLPSNSGRAGLGYSPSNYREGASEDKEGGVAQLGTFMYKGRKVLIPHISQSFISTCFIKPDIIAMVEDGQLESDLGHVYQCIPGTRLSNWTEEDVASDVYYAISDNESITNDNFNNHLPNFDHPINQAEEDIDEEWEASPELLRLVEQESREIQPHEE
ncbi:hypothetical protein Lal_00030317, partial [Lupinus albus]